MGRWEPDARGRLEQAALELYLDRGFDQTTVAEIASRAGLTERTFFRHFADKREVLFGGGALAESLAAAVDAAPEAQAPLDAVTAALESLSDFFADRHAHARRRQKVIAANPSLQERELIKLASLSSAMAGALRRRGVTEPAASLAAETGVAVFKVAFERWLDDTRKRTLAQHIRESLDELRTVTAVPTTERRSKKRS
jgi:AcrR family transcriptional regulator